MKERRTLITSLLEWQLTAAVASATAKKTA